MELDSYERELTTPVKEARYRDLYEGQTKDLLATVKVPKAGERWGTVLADVPRLKNGGYEDAEDFIEQAMKGHYRGWPKQQ